MCKARRHNVKEEIYDRITSLFISMYIQRNIKNVSLLKQLDYMSPKEICVAWYVYLGNETVYDDLLQLLVLPLSLGEQTSKLLSQMS